MARLATLINVPMDNLKIETFFFAVPNRLLWQDWKRFQGEQDNPTDSTDYLVPAFTVGDGAEVVEGSIGDYFGLPTNQQEYRCNALHFRAYNLIWNEWFRDQNLQDSIVVPNEQGDSINNYSLLRRGKRHDYFTSCLPWPQKGESVDLPLGISAPVVPGPSGTYGFGQPSVDSSDLTNVDINALDDGTLDIGDPAAQDTITWNDPALVADLTEASAATINQLRQAFAIQKLLERDARGGTRYIEMIKAHFGVTSPDSRQQRPEYLGGGSSPVMFHTTPQTSKTDVSGPDESPQANLASYGTASFTNHGFTYSATEHCVIIGLVNVRADLTYQQGLERMWSRQTRYDYFMPALQHLGEQEVLSKEIYVDGSPEDGDVFGYQERYAEYRYKPSRITGLFRSSASASLDSWHLAQEFENRPVLNQEFIQDDPPIDRIIAVADEPHLIADFYFKMTHARPMPIYGVPGMIDRF